MQARQPLGGCIALCGGRGFGFSYIVSIETQYKSYGGASYGSYDFK